MATDSREKRAKMASNRSEIIDILLNEHIDENRQMLRESTLNLDKIADYCVANYVQNPNKKLALEETRSYTTRALASLATQIHNLSSNLCTLLDEQSMAMDEMQGKVNFVHGRITFNEQKVARREIGKLARARTLVSTPKVVTSVTDNRANKSSRYVRQPIDYNVLDDVGQAHRINDRFARMANDGGASNANTLRYKSQVKSATLRPSKSSNLFSVMLQQQQQQQQQQSTLEAPKNSAMLAYGSQTLKPRTASGFGSHPMPTPMPVLSNQLQAPPASMAQSFAASSSTLLRNPKEHRASLVPAPIVPPPKLATQDTSEQESVPSQAPPAAATWIPEDYIEKVTAIYDYAADKDDELSFEENAIIYVIRKNDDGWYEGVLNGITGLFPGNYVEPWRDPKYS